MSSGPDELRETEGNQFRDTAEALEIIQAQELAAMDDVRAAEIIRSLGAFEPWRERPDWSGLVEQQALFHRKPRP